MKFLKDTTATSTHTTVTSSGTAVTSAGTTAISSGAAVTSAGTVFPGEFAYTVPSRPVDVTSGTGMPSGSLGNRRITEQVTALLPKIALLPMRMTVENLIRATEEAAFSLGLAGRDVNSLPPVRGVIDKEGSVFLEWIARDFRIGFDVEPDPHKSGWYVVSSGRLGDLSLQGELSAINPQSLIATVVRFALDNS